MKKTGREERERHISAWQTSGLSKKEYSRLNGINPGTFYTWFRENRDTSADGFIEIEVDQFEHARSNHAVPDGKITIVLPNGYQVTIGKGFDQEALSAVINVLEAR